MTEAGVEDMYTDTPTVQKMPLSMEGWVKHGFEHARLPSPADQSSGLLWPRCPALARRPRA